MKGILDEPSCRTFMKNSDKQKNDQTERKMRRVRLKPCNDQMKLSNEIKRKLGTPEKKDETNETENFKGLRNKELITWMNKNKNYVMLILHQFKLMTNNGSHTTYSRRKD